jgi:hypothetical protein
MSKKKQATPKEEKYFAVVLLCIGDPEFTCKDDNNNPILFTSRKEAWKDIAETKIQELKSFLDGMKEVNDDDESYAGLFDLDYTVCEVRREGTTIIGFADDCELEHASENGTEFTVVFASTIALYIHEDLTGRNRNPKNVTGTKLKRIYKDNTDDQSIHGVRIEEFLNEAQPGDKWEDESDRYTRVQ